MLNFKAMMAAPAAVPQFVEEVFSTYLYTGNGSTQTITNGIQIGGAPETVSFSTPSLMNGSTAYASMRAVAVSSSGRFVAVGFNSSGQGVFATSTDGSTWTTPALFNGSTASGQFYAVAVSGSGRFVAVGFESSGSAPVFTTSTDGTTWTSPARINGFSTYARMFGIAVNSSGRFVAVGFNASDQPLFTTSTDGTTWTSPALMNGSTASSQQQAIVATSSGGFVSIGYNATNKYPTYATSANGTTWTTPATIASTYCELYSVTVNSSGKFVAVGYNNSNQPMFTTSTDGTTWTTPALINGFSSYTRMNAVAVNSSGLFVTIGYNGSFQGVFSTSTDGSTWTTPILMNSSTDANVMLGLTINSGGKFVSVGLQSGSTAPVYSTSTNVAAITGKGGMTWIKGRSGATDHALYDTARGATKDLVSNSTAAETTQSTGLTAFNSNGFSVGALAKLNTSAATYASWTFRKAPKFFDIVTWTGNSVTGRQIAHNLGSVPGMIIVKNLSSTLSWYVYHRSIGDSSTLYLNLTNPVASTIAWDNTSPTSTYFTLRGTSDVNSVGNNYVAYLFAHDAGGFGEAGDQNVVSCGAFTTDSGGNATVNLGWEPQFVMQKRSSIAGGWQIFDVMRGYSLGGSQFLEANTSSADTAIAANVVYPTATGFEVKGLVASTTFVYLAIRRGPMKKPTSGTQVFTPVARTGDATANQIDVGFPVDFWFTKNRASTTGWVSGNRLAGLGRHLTFNNTAAEINFGTPAQSAVINNGVLYGDSGVNNPPIDSSGVSYVDYWFRRAPGFFDVVCYTSPGVSPDPQIYSHNLGVEPELIVVKSRNNVYDWAVYQSGLGTNNLTLNGNFGAGILNSRIESATSSTFTVGTQGQAGGITNGTYVAYLFATLPGVSKVGSYTGTGTTQQINCGFTTGARFVLIKRTDSTGNWYVWDTARGISTSNDPYLLLNSTAAEVTNTDYIDPLASGFEISSTAPAEINASGGTFIYLAIA